LFLGLLILSSCYTQTDDFISKYCPGSCTVITGKLTTDGRSQPLAGVKLDVIWEATGYLSGNTRRKATTTSDANGNYELRFLMRDDELPDIYGSSGTITLKAQLKPDKYITCAYNNELYTSYNLGRDSVITLNYNIAQKAQIKITAQNTAAMQPQDYMYTQFITDIAGESAEDDCLYGLTWLKNDTQKEAEIAANQQVILQTKKNKVGTETITEDIVTLQPGEVYNYQITF